MKPIREELEELYKKAVSNGEKDLAFNILQFIWEIDEKKQG